ncbi:MAG: histidinol-phosphate transaminase [Gammaproteobacteria bacterium]
MNKYWSDSIRSLAPYVPGEQPRGGQVVKLNTNECPYPPSPAALDAVRAQAGADLRLYPDPDGSALKAAIAEFHGLSPAEVFLGNGSDEVLAHAFLGLLKQSRPLLFPDITYSFYPVYCALYGIAYEPVALREDFRVAVEDYARPSGGIILPNPNAPTGSGLDLADIERLLAAHPEVVVVIDEAYVDFGAASAVPLIARHPNLLVVQTFSKSRALAGLRVGFALGDANLVNALETVKGCFNSYPLDRVALAAAEAAMRDRAWFEATCARIIASRERLTAALAARDFEVLPSQANFVFARHPAHDGAALHAALREHGVLVRHFAKPRIADFLRITVGTEDECARLVSVLDAILA